MTIRLLNMDFSIVKLKKETDFDKKALYSFYARTGEEISLVCPTEIVPKEIVVREDNWRGFYIKGELDFSLVGILADISSALAKKHIPVCAVSTYDTDYFFIKSNFLSSAWDVLAEKGYTMER